jgi:LmbE family N-acetylglucosaminyl deacetylase
MFDYSKQRLLVIAPHADDEVLGCAGLMQKVKKVGGRVYVQFLTVGDTKDFSKKGASTTKERMDEIKKVMRFLKVDAFDIGHQGENHMKLDTVGRMEIMRLIERDSPISIQTIKPTIITFPSKYSYNQDHEEAAAAVHSALRPAETTTKHFVPTVMAYEMPLDSWSLHHQIVPNIFVPLTKKEVAAKKRAMELYASQMRPWPNPRSLDAIESLARLRGINAAAEFAEAYIGYRTLL